MNWLRQAKIDGIAADLPPLMWRIRAATPGLPGRAGIELRPDLGAARRVRLSGRSVATVHLRHLNLLPSDLGDILVQL